MKDWFKKYWQFIAGILVASILLNFFVNWTLKAIAKLKDHSISIEEDEQRRRGQSPAR